MGIVILVICGAKRSFVEVATRLVISKSVLVHLCQECKENEDFLLQVRTWMAEHRTELWHIAQNREGSVGGWLNMS